MSIDPLVRLLLRESTYAGQREVRRLVDDLAAVLQCMRTTLPVLLAALSRWRGVPGLALKGSKCAFSPLWTGGVEEFREYLQTEASLPSALVETSARDLGVTVGVDTRGRQWGGVAFKLRRWREKLPRVAPHCRRD